MSLKNASREEIEDRITDCYCHGSAHWFDKDLDELVAEIQALVKTNERYEAALKKIIAALADPRPINRICRIFDELAELLPELEEEKRCPLKNE